MQLVFLPLDYRGNESINLTHSFIAVIIELKLCSQNTGWDAAGTQLQTSMMKKSEPRNGYEKDHVDRA